MPLVFSTGPLLLYRLQPNLAQTAARPPRTRRPSRRPVRAHLSPAFSQRPKPPWRRRHRSWRARQGLLGVRAPIKGVVSCAPPWLHPAAARPQTPLPPPYFVPRWEPSRLKLATGRSCRMDLPGPTTSVGTRTDYSVGPWDYPTCAARHLMA
jgi:hypothetical protein